MCRALMLASPHVAVQPSARSCLLRLRTMRMTAARVALQSMETLRTRRGVRHSSRVSSGASALRPPADQACCSSVKRCIGVLSSCAEFNAKPLEITVIAFAGGVNAEAVQAIADRKRERIRDSQLASTSGRRDSSDGHARGSDDRRHRDSRDSDRCLTRLQQCAMPSYPAYCQA
jgi:hypothetical protein